MKVLLIALVLTKRHRKMATGEKIGETFGDFVEEIQVLENASFGSSTATI